MSGDSSKVAVYVDRPEVSEIFADAVEHAVVEGGVVRFEFSVNRFDHPQPSKTPKGKRYAACRLVLSMAASVDLYNRLNQLMELMKKQGAVTTTPPGPLSPKTIQ